MTAENNGGKTGYYDLPKTTETQKLDTLNDLIEFKQMQPWQHEVFKATYAIEDRAKKNGGSRLREINKILYYAERGRQLELARLAAEGTTSKEGKAVKQDSVFNSKPPMFTDEERAAIKIRKPEELFLGTAEAVEQVANTRLTKHKLVIPTTHEPFFGNESQL